jgi:hypothetical protein
LADEVVRLAGKKGRERFETRTGFSVFGTRPISATARLWTADNAFQEGGPDAAWHLRLHPQNPNAEHEPSSISIEFESGTGIPLPVLSGFIGTIVVEDARVVSVSYVPSAQNWRFHDYEREARRLDQMKAFAAVAARQGKFVIEDEKAHQLADRIRQGKGIDPTLGLFAAYAYAQVGEYDDVYSVFKYMRDDELPVPFDVALLATRYDGNKGRADQTRYAPFAPMLSQGWALLMPGDPLYQPIHGRIRSHLIPSLWTTIAKSGLAMVRDSILSKEVL